MQTSSWARAAALAALALIAGAQAVQAAPKKPATAKKPVAKPGGPVVLGTKQLPGNFGKFGTTYTIGKDNPINFTLNSAEYRTDRFVIGSSIYGTEADKKVLVLNYTVQNPLSSEQSLGWSTLRFTAVDDQDTNHEYIQETVRTGTNKESLSMNLKPAQKVNVTTAIEVPAEGVMPKLIVARNSDDPVVRYDLRGKVKPIPAPFADPSDPTGVTALKNIPVPAGTTYIPTGRYDIKLDSVGYTTGSLNGETPEEGRRFFTAIFTVKNATPSAQSYGWSTWKPLVKDADGEKVEYNQNMLKASRDEAASGNLEPGEETRVRYYFEMPANVDAKTISMTEGEGRTLVFDVSIAKPA